MTKLTINPNRISEDEAYMQMAEIWAKRSKANRLQVGALLVKNRQITSDGYNGMPVGCEGDDEICEYLEDASGMIKSEPEYVLRTKPEVLHAEANAILKISANGGVGAEGATLYVTYSPCPECAKLIKQAKISRVVYRNHYRLPEGVAMLERMGVKCDQLESEEKKQARERVAASGAPSLTELMGKFGNWSVPEVSGKIEDVKEHLWLQVDVEKDRTNFVCGHCGEKDWVMKDDPAGQLINTPCKGKV